MKEHRANCVAGQPFATEALSPGLLLNMAAVIDSRLPLPGFAICFDSFFNEVWERLASQGAELVIYPSDAPGGILLVAQAVMRTTRLGCRLTVSAWPSASPALEQEFGFTSWRVAH
jgi:predicted amidohydrolase